MKYFAPKPTGYDATACLESMLSVPQRCTRYFSPGAPGTVCLVHRLAPACTGLHLPHFFAPTPINFALGEESLVHAGCS